MVKKINIRELKDNVNYLMFSFFNSDLERLKLSNEVCERLGGTINETIDKVNTN